MCGREWTGPVSTAGGSDALEEVRTNGLDAECAIGGAVVWNGAFGVLWQSQTESSVSAARRKARRSQTAPL